MRLARQVAAFSAACLLLNACAEDGQQMGHLEGLVVSGPTCPAEPDDESPSTGCEDQPVAGATIVVRAQDGGKAVSVATDETGAYNIELTPGDYLVVPQEVQGLLGTPEPTRATLVAGQATTMVPLRYDTGIRSSEP